MCLEIIRADWQAPEGSVVWCCDKSMMKSAKSAHHETRIINRTNPHDSIKPFLYQIDQPVTEIEIQFDFWVAFLKSNNMWHQFSTQIRETDA
ncbi:hypothetical protein KMAL_30500 [Novacetimonas maltaceti]|uniref:Uncharacterized protein n=2 Tax=Acetobacteraceae TaxID=433 RepID=A0A2S3VXG3_9PROT|nr:hypothetical protein KMAL_30500 [Novacetimonas maltaceti]GAN96477.1 hypothetical protein Geu3261_0070_018 [Komagataeibacter europaeus NBRC 3261]